jgi:hypothetical protein
MVKLAGQPARLDNEKVIQTAPQSNPANSEILNSMTNDAQERCKDPSVLLKKEQVSTGCRWVVGLPQKPTPSGKPRDMQTEARGYGR